MSDGALLCVPYDPWRGDQSKNDTILRHLQAHPLWFASGQTPDEIAINVYSMMVDPAIWKFEVWQGAEIVGMIVLDRVVPRSDAVLHFTLWKSNAFRLRTLLWNFMGWAFSQFDLQRISCEVPENERKLDRFLRQRLGFTYSGELNLRLEPAVQFLATPGDSGRHHTPEAHVWMARQCSRRERAHFDGRKWRDLLLLRLMRSEYEARGMPEAETQATRDTSPEASQCPSEPSPPSISSSPLPT